MVSVQYDNHSVFEPMLSMRRIWRYVLVLGALLGLYALIYSPKSYSWRLDRSHTLQPTPPQGPFPFEKHDTDENGDIILPHRNGALHLLIPATSGNEHLCRLLLSTTALGYPTPVLINWDKKEDEDPYKEHVKKIYGSLEYLSKLSEQHDKDLVLMVDGFDVWFQLRPEVLIQRYYKVITAANERLFERVGIDAARQIGVWNSVIFGADKLCWPKNASDVACWGAPQSTLPEDVFGPHTDAGSADTNRPRWLNSGTIMGPVADVRNILRATVNLIETVNTTIISDQLHILTLWGDQEYARSALALDPMRRWRHKIWVPRGKFGKGKYKEIMVEPPPTPALNNEKEYHIALDYESELFQLATYYHQYLAWVKYDNSTRQGQVSPQYPVDESHHFELAPDIASSPAGFPRRTRNGGESGDRIQDSSLPESISWNNLSLGTNTISRHVFPIIHFTPPKILRRRWWPRMWYYPYAKAIIDSSAEIARGPYGTTKDNRTWTNAESSSAAGSKGAGVVDASGRWIPWSYICANHKDAVFSNEREYVPKPKKPTPTLSGDPQAVESIDPTRSLIF